MMVKELIENRRLDELAKLYADAKQRKAELENEALRIRLEFIDPDVRTALDKQELKLMAQNQRYRELIEEINLLKALIRSCEFALEALKMHKEALV